MLQRPKKIDLISVVKNIFCFRFDVDTSTCVSQGMPALVDLGERNNCHFTFFVNMGCAVSRKIILRSLFDMKHREACADKLPALRKFGIINSIHTLMMNRCVGANYAENIKNARNKGHEIGLHGGVNHAEWQYEASSWTIERIESEVSFGLAELEKMGISDLLSFSSPGWSTPPHLFTVLQAKGFRIVADSHGTKNDSIVSVDDTGQLISIPTALTGEPCGVGYIENLRARKYSDNEILNELDDFLRKKPDFAVLYDHPGYVGRKELRLLSSIIKKVREHDYHIMPIAELARNMKPHNYC